MGLGELGSSASIVLRTSSNCWIISSHPAPLHLRFTLQMPNVQVARKFPFFAYNRPDLVYWSGHWNPACWNKGIWKDLTGLLEIIIMAFRPQQPWVTLFSTILECQINQNDAKNGSGISISIDS